VILKWCREQTNLGKGIPFKPFLSKNGFLVHLCMTYKFLTLFLKGFHLLTDSWRKNQAADRWMVQDRDWESYLQEALEKGKIDESDYVEMMSWDGDEDKAPDTLDNTAVLHFEDDLSALEMFFQLAAPPLVSDRVSKLAPVIYAFKDASGLGFGDIFLFDSDIEYTIGTW
jgi:hypothetical protein